MEQFGGYPAAFYSGLYPTSLKAHEKFFNKRGFM